MKWRLLALAITAFLAEIITSWWVWTSQAMDGAVERHYGSFSTYEAERVVPWLVIFAILFGLMFLVNKLAKK